MADFIDVPSVQDGDTISSDLTIELVPTYFMTVDAELVTLVIDDHTIILDGSALTYIMTGDLFVMELESVFSLKQFDQSISIVTDLGRMDTPVFTMIQDIFPIPMSGVINVARVESVMTMEADPPIQEAFWFVALGSRISCEMVMEYTKPEYSMLGTIDVCSIEILSSEMHMALDYEMSFDANLVQLELAQAQLTYELFFSFHGSMSLGGLEAVSFVMDQDQDQSAIWNEVDVAQISSSMQMIMRGFLFDPLARRRISVDQSSPEGVCYPLLSDQSDATLLSCLADFYLAYRDGDFEIDFKLPFKITYLYGLGDADSDLDPPVGYPAGKHKYDLIIRDANDELVVDTTEADYCTTNMWGVRIEVAQWVVGDVVVRAAFHVAFREQSDVTSFDMYLLPSEGRLQPRTVDKLPARVKSLSCNLITIEGDDVQVNVGYNCAIDITQNDAEDGERRKTTLTIHGDAGSGLGYYYDCETQLSYLRQINEQVADDKGRFQLSGDACFRISPVIDELDDETAILSPGKMLIDQDGCLPCCSCKDLVALYKTAKALWERIQAVGREAEYARDSLVRVIDRYETRVGCSLDNPVRVKLEPFCPCSALVTITFCNYDSCAIVGLEMNVNISGLGNGRYLKTSCLKNDGQSTITKPYTMTGAYPILGATWEILHGNQTAILRFVVEAENCSSNMRVTASVTSESGPGGSGYAETEMIDVDPETGSCD